MGEKVRIKKIKLLLQEYSEWDVWDQKRWS